MKKTLRDIYVALYVEDVLKNPECFSDRVLSAPKRAAERTISDMNDDEIGLMLSDLRAEIRACEKVSQ